MCKLLTWHPKYIYLKNIRQALFESTYVFYKLLVVSLYSNTVSNLKKQKFMLIKITFVITIVKLKEFGHYMAIF